MLKNLTRIKILIINKGESIRIGKQTHMIITTDFKVRRALAALYDLSLFCEWGAPLKKIQSIINFPILLLRKMRNRVVQMTIASLTASAHAERQDVLPKLTSTMRVEDLTHSQHTRDANGQFKHPFLNAPPELQTISYTQSGSFSTKLHRV